MGRNVNWCRIWRTRAQSPKGLQIPIHFTSPQLFCCQLELLFFLSYITDCLSYVVYSSLLKMQAIGLSKLMLFAKLLDVTFQRDCNLHGHYCENLKFHVCQNYSCNESITASVLKSLVTSSAL
jgi:hypothetical protein